MKKISLFTLLGLTVFLSGCLKFTPQSEFEANQKAQESMGIKAQDSFSLDVQGDVPQNSTGGEANGGEPTATPAPTSMPTASITVVPPDDIWKAAEFPSEYRHSYEINYPDSLTFASGGDTDSFSESTVKDSKGIVVAQIRDYVLLGCPDTDSQCNIDERVQRTPSQAFSAIVKDYVSGDWKIVNSGVALRQVKNPATQLQHPDGNMLYVMQLENGVVSIFMGEQVHLDLQFMKLFLDSLVSAK